MYSAKRIYMRNYAKSIESFLKIDGMMHKRLFILLMAFLMALAVQGTAGAESYPYRLSHDGGLPDFELSVFGFQQYHVIQGKETLLDVARNYGLGFNEIELCHPDIDPWIPGDGTRLAVPTQWILPPTRHEEVVINIPEMRLYRFFKKISMVKTYPIGIGREGFETPLTVARVVNLKENPAWTVPPSAWDTYGKIVVAPGPDNPLGDYWIGLSEKHIGIHGTNYPWGVGRLVSRGCIRMYPEHVSLFFKEVKPGTTVEIIYEPVKIGISDGLIFLEVHPDLYCRIPDMRAHTEALITQKGLRDRVDWTKVYQCVQSQHGAPEVIGSIGKGGDGIITAEKIR